MITQRALKLYADRVDPAALPDEEVPPTLATLDRESLAVQRSWAFAPGDYPSSPCFAPRGAGEGLSDYAGDDPGGHHGWLVVPVLNDGGFRVEEVL